MARYIGTWRGGGEYFKGQQRILAGVAMGTLTSRQPLKVAFGSFSFSEKPKWLVLEDDQFFAQFSLFSSTIVKVHGIVTTHVCGTHTRVEVPRMCTVQAITHSALGH